MAQCLWQRRHNHMAVGAADTERRHACMAQRCAPVLRGREQPKRAFVQRQRRVGRLDVEGGRQRAVLHCHHGLEQAGNACGGVHMAEVAFDRSQCTAR